MSLEPKERLTVRIKKPAIHYILGMNSNLEYNEVVFIIRSILEELRDTLFMELQLWIEEKVPKRTGQLRKDLIDNLKESNIVGYALHVILGTTIDYADQVNAMATSQVRHQGEVGYVYYWNPFGIRGRVILYDPRAIGNFWTHLLEYAKERVMVNIGKIKAKYAAKTNITLRNLSQLKAGETKS